MLRWQRLDGSIRWSLDPSGFLEEYALLTGSSSIYHSLRCAIACAERLGHERPDWELAAGRLAHAVAHEPDGLRPQGRVRHGLVLPGALRGPDRRGGPAPHRRRRGTTFVMDGRGVRCVSTGEWVTAAETAECVLALDALGMDDEALDLLTWVPGACATRTAPTGRAWSTPRRRPSRRSERSTYTAGAMVLAADALSRTTPASGLFRGEGLPSHLDLTEPAPEAPVEPASCGAPGQAWTVRLGSGVRRLDAASAPSAGGDPQHPQRAALAVLDELAGVEGGPPDVVRRPAAVGRVGEDVVDGQPAAHAPRGAPSPGSRPTPAPRRGRRR